MATPQQRLVGDFDAVPVDDEETTVDEPRLERPPGPLRWALDRSPQLDVVHRPDHHVVAVHQPSERVELDAPIQLVGPHDDHDTVIRVARRGHDPLDVLQLIVSSQAADEELLELVDDEQPTTTRSDVVRAGADLVATSSGSRRRFANHRRPGAHRCTKAGTSPARTTEDLPLPDGPTTASSRAPASLAINSATSRSRPAMC